jgi:hypothetical protein
VIIDLLALKTLQSGPTNGWDIDQRIRQVSQDVCGKVRDRCIRSCIGWKRNAVSEWGENNRKAKYYKLDCRRTE